LHAKRGTRRFDVSLVLPQAINWFSFTGELKSTRISLICPETWEPTCTETTGFRVPVADTAAVSGPLSALASLYFGASPIAP
jgi:hypothetical protein